MLIRRKIDTAHNFVNKPVFFACNGVQIRRRVSHKAGTEEDGRTAQNSRNASRARKKNLQMAARKSGGRAWRSTESSGDGCSIQGVQPRRGTGKGQREGARLRTVGGYRGEQEWKEGRQARRGEKVRRGVVVWVQLLARAYIYSSYI